VLAFWQNQACIDRFMLTAHDKIFDANKQVDTYSQCRVNYFSIQFDINRAWDVIPDIRAGFTAT
jgi:hypothetical protein